MKIRSGFVSNSSSSSFVIDKFFLSPFQIKAIHDHIKYADELALWDFPAWEITETDKAIEGYTTIDNFDMREFLKYIHVDLNMVNWEGTELERFERMNHED